MPTCGACASAVWKTRFHKQGFSFIECRRCGLLQLDPIPTVEQLNEHYAKRSQSGHYKMASSEEVTLALEGLLQAIRKVHPTPGRIFDVGCFYGKLLDLAQDAGWQTYGLEFQGPAAEYAARRHRIFTQTVEEFDAAECGLAGAMDVVSGTGVIEHVRDAEAMMRLAHSLLRPGGIFFLQTPNWGSWLARLMQRYWFPIAAPEHIRYFSPRSLSALCKRSGFEPLTWTSHWKTLRVGYAFDQLQHFGPEAGRVIGAVRPFLPRFIENWRLRMFGGEMIFIAKRAEHASSGEVGAL